MSFCTRNHHLFSTFTFQWKSLMLKVTPKKSFLYTEWNEVINTIYWFFFTWYIYRKKETLNCGTCFGTDEFSGAKVWTKKSVFFCHQTWVTFWWVGLSRATPHNDIKNQDFFIHFIVWIYQIQYLEYRSDCEFDLKYKRMIKITTFRRAVPWVEATHQPSAFLILQQLSKGHSSVFIFIRLRAECRKRMTAHVENWVTTWIGKLISQCIIIYFAESKRFH